MKYLILFLISFSAFGNYVKQSELDNVKTVFTSLRSCGSDCIKIPRGFNQKTHKKEEIQVPDYDSPIVSKSEAETCSAVADDPATTEIDESKDVNEVCVAVVSSKTCTDSGERVIYVIDESDQDQAEAYCTKTTFPLIGSGKFQIVEDATMKAAYDAVQAVKAAKQSKKAIGRAKRSKCEDSLNYISGSMDSNTEAQSDAVEVAFGSIQEALMKCRYKKAKRLIGLVSDPSYAQLKADLLEILE